MEALDGLPPQKLHCSVLAEEAIKAALLDFYTKTGRELPEELKNVCSHDCTSCCTHCK